MMDLEPKGELPAPRSSFSIFDPKIHLVVKKTTAGSYLERDLLRILVSRYDFRAMKISEGPWEVADKEAKVPTLMTAVGPGNIEEAGQWVKRSTERFAACLNTIISSRKRGFLSKWHSETLESVLVAVSALEDALIDALDKGTGLPKHSKDRKVTAKPGRAEDLATTALRTGMERLVGVAAGSSHTLLLTGGGKVLAFGCGAHGCLGTGRQNDEPSPVFVTAARAVRIVQVTAGCNFSLMLTEGGEVLTAGSNDNGQLGVGDRRPRTKLCEALVRGHRIAHISAGAHFSLLVTDDGYVMSCGDGASGQLGHGSRESASTPTLIPFFSEADNPALRAHAGGDHSLCICEDHSIYSWGRGCFGRLGLGDENDTLKPTYLQDLEQMTALEICAGGAHTLILARRYHEGSVATHVLSFGCARDGQLGHPPTEPLGELRNELRPKVIHDLSQFHPVEIAAGDFHSLVRTEKGLFAFGLGAFGRLGLGNCESTSVPKQVGQHEGRKALDDSELAEVPAAEESSEPDGPVHLMSVTDPIRVSKHCPDAFNGGVMCIGAGKDHSVALTAAGDAYLWGRNSNGQIGCGVGSSAQQRQPVLLSDLAPMNVPHIQDDRLSLNYIEGQRHREALTAKLVSACAREADLKTDIDHLVQRGNELAQREFDSRAENLLLLQRLEELRREKVAADNALQNIIETKEKRERDFEKRLQRCEATVLQSEEHQMRLVPLIIDGRIKREYERKLRYRRLTLDTCIFNVESILEEGERIRLGLARQLQASQAREAELQFALRRLNNRVAGLSRRTRAFANDRLGIMKFRRSDSAK